MDTQAASFDVALAEARPWMERLACRLVFHRQDAEDVVQSALAKAWAQYTTLKDVSALRGWLKKIVVHEAMSHLRRRKLFDAFSWLLFVDSPAATDDRRPDAQFEQRHHLTHLANALRTLPLRQSTCFSLRYLEGLRIDEVADATGLTRGTVRVHLQRAIKRLRHLGIFDDGAVP